MLAQSTSPMLTDKTLMAEGFADFFQKKVDEKIRGMVENTPILHIERSFNGDGLQ